MPSNENTKILIQLAGDLGQLVGETKSANKNLEGLREEMKETYNGLNEILEGHRERILSLEESRAKAIGGALGISGLISALGAFASHAWK